MGYIPKNINGPTELSGMVVCVFFFFSFCLRMFTYTYLHKSVKEEIILLYMYLV